jgi:exopolyphosphatase/guanosine-5'-triphosphate,3'-diphosphate pyrophosphatase
MLEALEPLTVPEREAIPGMEEGRGDLVLPGMRIVLGTLALLGQERLTVSDFGLLEGVLLDSYKCPLNGRNR